MRILLSRSVWVLVALFLAACGTGSPDGTPGVPDSQAESNAGLMADFKEDPCAYLTGAEVRAIFSVPEGVEMVADTRYMPCSYDWEMEDPDTGIIKAVSAGISYIVTVAKTPKAARASYDAATANISQEKMQEQARDAADKALDGSTLPESTKEGVTETAEKVFGKKLAYSSMDGVGDAASWESTYSSLVVLSGQVVFRTIANSSWYDGGVKRVQLPEKAAEIARAALSKK
jgi:hypothetical protein